MLGLSFTSPLMLIAIGTAVATLAAGIYLLLLKRQLATLKKSNPAEAMQYQPPEETELLRYSEYKRRYGSRNRDIAIIAPEKHQLINETIDEFINTIRREGSLRYHFTHYWGLTSDIRGTQSLMTAALKNNHSALFTIGGTLTRVARQMTSAQSAPTPVVFARVRKPLWNQEKMRGNTAHMTGVTAESGWPQRVALYLAIKPQMRSVLIPITHPILFEIAQEVTDLLNESGVRTQVIRTHSHPDIMHAITQYSDQIDSVIRLFDSLNPHEVIELTSRCATHGITYFSPELPSSALGAAISMSSINEHAGWYAAQKMIAILEEHKTPQAIPITCVGETNQYEVHFNQRAMSAQGLNPLEIIPIFAMRYGSRIHGYIPYDKPGGLS